MRLLLLRPLYIALFSFSLLTSSAAGNDGTDSRVRGRVLDQNNAVVTGASVTALNTTTKQLSSTTTDTAGEFSFLLGPGEYVVEVTANGFNSLSRQLIVSPNSQEVIEISLEIGAAKAIVTVTDGGGNYQVDTVYSAARMPIANRDLPQAVSVVGRQQISDQLF